MRLTIWYAGSMLVLLLLFGATMVSIIHWRYNTILNERLFKIQSELVARVTVVDGQPKVVPSLGEEGGPLELPGVLGTYVRLLSRQGRILEESTNFHGIDAFAPQAPSTSEIGEAESDWQGYRIRSTYTPIVASGELVGWLEVSGFPQSLELRSVGLSITLVLLITAVLALAGGYILARRALKPVVGLTEAANRITASDLDIRLPVHTRIRDELTDLAETFNGMISRLDASFERERRFTADAAHEILNPLASVRNEIEVALRLPRDQSDYRQTLDAILTDVKRLGTMIDQLLALSRIEAGADKQPEIVDVDEFVTGCAEKWAPTALEKGISLECRAESGATVAVHAQNLGTVVDNLLDNALKYTSEGGRVAVDVSTLGQEVSITVADSGIGFEPASAVGLFDRFRRGGATSVQSVPGSGLGLAIVRAIVQASGGTIDAASEGPERGSRFVVRLPALGAGIADIVPGSKF